MPLAIPDFLDQSDSMLTFKGTRLTIVDVLALYNQGYAAEMIAIEYPSVSLAIVHHFIAFYLDNQPPLDAIVAGHAQAVEIQRLASPHHISLADLRRRLNQSARV